MKTASAFLQVLDKAETKMKQMGEALAAARVFYEAGNVTQAYESAMKLEEASERTVLLTRALPAYTGSPYAAMDTSNVIALCIPVEIGFTAEGWFALRIPALLPKKQTGSADYIRSFLYPAMREFFMGKEPVRFPDCVLAYRHVYDRSRPERKKRDHDNIEINMVSDIVAMYVMPDDGPEVCAHYYCSAEGTQERTEVYVVPREEFPMWLVTEKSMPEKGVTLYENRQIWSQKDM